MDVTSLGMPRFSVRSISGLAGPRPSFVIARQGGGRPRPLRGLLDRRPRWFLTFQGLGAACLCMTREPTSGRGRACGPATPAGRWLMSFGPNFGGITAARPTSSIAFSRGQSGRHPIRAARHVRAGHQLKGRWRFWPDDSGGTCRSRRQGHPMRIPPVGLRTTKRSSTAC